MDQEQRVAAGESRAGRVFYSRPDRVAAAWRRLCCAQRPHVEEPNHLLDDVVESFVQELGESLLGKPGSPWSRTRGVLRLSPVRGVKALFDEFALLRQCLLTSLDVLGAGDGERAGVERALEEAADGAVALLESLQRGDFLPLPGQFGGVVLELFERASVRALAHEPATTLVH